MGHDCLIAQPFLDPVAISLPNRRTMESLDLFIHEISSARCLLFAQEDGTCCLRKYSMGPGGST